MMIEAKTQNTIKERDRQTERRTDARVMVLPNITCIHIHMHAQRIADFGGDGVIYHNTQYIFSRLWD